jgi:hypothetical protein
MSFRRISKRFSVLPWLALGPLTGPLAWRMYLCARRGDHVLAGLYGAAIVAIWIVMVASSGQALAALSH